MKISFASDLPTTGAIVVPALQNALDTAAVKSIDEVTDHAISRAIKAARFEGKVGETLTIPAPKGREDAVFILLGLGKADSLDHLTGLTLGGKAYAAVKGKADHLAIELPDGGLGKVSGGQLAAEVALGIRLRAYDFDIYRVKTKPEKVVPLEAAVIVTPHDKDASDLLAEQDAIAAGVKTARDLVSEPPNILYPASFAERCKELEEVGLEVIVLDEAKMTELGMGSLLGVGQGSVRESQLAIMIWNGGEKGEAPVALVGKGVTFDTGGISIKPAPGMEDMKFDMGGAAAVTGAMHALAARKAKVNAVGLIGLVENMPDGNAQRPADVVKSMSGQTIEVLNTDAEGRLVLADVLTYTQKTYKPKAIVDLATLTGAIIVSLAHEFGGLFSKDDGIAEALLKAGDTSGEKLWRMPLTKAHDDMIKSDIADMKNIGGRDGGSSSAAAFLARFVEDDVPWAHLDIAGMAWTKKDEPVCPKGATGYGVRLLNAWVKENYEG